MPQKRTQRCKYDNNGQGAKCQNETVLWAGYLEWTWATPQKPKNHGSPLLRGCFQHEYHLVDQHQGVLQCGYLEEQGR